MAIILFTHPVAFPIASLRAALRLHLPLYRWQCGAADMGGRDDAGSFADAALITGRDDDTLIFTALTPHDGPWEQDAPPHRWHLTIGHPTTELDAIAERLTLLIARSVMAGDEGARCRLVDAGAWLSAAALGPVLDRVLAGEGLASALDPARTLSPPDVPRLEPATAAPTIVRPGNLPAPVPRRSGFGRKGL